MTTPTTDGASSGRSGAELATLAKDLEAATGRTHTLFKRGAGRGPASRYYLVRSGTNVTGVIDAPSMAAFLRAALREANDHSAQESR